MPKLYEVEVSYIVYVVADDLMAAEEIGAQYAHENNEPSTYANEIESADKIDPTWKDALPYKEDGCDEVTANPDETCLQVFQRLHPPPPEPPYVDPNQLELPGL